MTWVKSDDKSNGFKKAKLMISHDTSDIVEKTRFEGDKELQEKKFPDEKVN